MTDWRELAGCETEHNRFEEQYYSAFLCAKEYLCRKQKRLKTQEVRLRRITFFVLRYNRRIVTLCVEPLYSYR